MISFKVTVTKIDDEASPKTVSGESPEVFCQIIPDTEFDLKRFVRDLNATPRKRRKTKSDSSAA